MFLGEFTFVYLNALFEKYCLYKSYVYIKHIHYILVLSMIINILNI